MNELIHNIYIIIVYITHLFITHLIRIIRYKELSIILLCVIALTNCATIIQGQPDEIPIISIPENASVYLNESFQCKTPCTIRIKHNMDAAIKIEMAGYDTIYITKTKYFSGWLLGNLAFAQAGIIGMVVDLATSNQGHYSEEPVSVNLKKITLIP